MTTENKPLLNEERSFLLDELFFSTTDLHGKITSWNEVFERISGYSGAELINKPHSIIRHPDMPRGVFQLLWDMIQNKELVGAYVKNRAADGRFYWVYALVIPINEGYLSIRIKPSSKYFEIIPGFYRELLAFENGLINAGTKKSDAAVQSKEKLLAELKKLNFECYRSFMNTTLVEEMVVREKSLAVKRKEQLDQTIERRHKASENRVKLDKVEANLLKLFNELATSLELTEQIKANYKETHVLANEIKLGAINATIEASRLGASGESLFVLADYLGTNGGKTINELGAAEVICTQSLNQVSDILFEICSAKLQTECLSYFLSELESNRKDSEAKYALDPFDVLKACFKNSLNGMAQRYQGLERVFSSVLSVLEDIRLLFVSLKIAHVSAKTEASRIPNALRFGQIFDEVCSVVEHARSIIDLTNTKLSSYISLLKHRESECEAIQNASQGF